MLLWKNMQQSNYLRKDPHLLEKLLLICKLVLLLNRLTSWLEKEDVEWTTDYMTLHNKC